MTRIAGNCSREKLKFPASAAQHLTRATPMHACQVQNSLHILVSGTSTSSMDIHSHFTSQAHLCSLRKPSISMHPANTSSAVMVRSDSEQEELIGEFLGHFLAICRQKSASNYLLHPSRLIPKVLDPKMARSQDGEHQRWRDLKR